MRRETGKRSLSFCLNTNEEIEIFSVLKSSKLSYFHGFFLSAMHKLPGHWNIRDES